MTIETAFLGAISCLLFGVVIGIDRLEKTIKAEGRMNRERMSHPQDEHLRFQLEVFLEEANRETHARTRESLQRKLDEGIRAHSASTSCGSDQTAP